VNLFLEWLSRLVSSWKFWIVVPPWDIGVRVRLGKIARPLLPGLHFRIPFVDDVILVNTRLRVATTPAVTINNGTIGKARIITAVVGYSVTSPILAMNRYASPESAILSITAAAIPICKDADECLIDIKAKIAGTGVAVDFVRYIEDVDGVRTLRLINGTSSIWAGPTVNTPGFDQTSRY
jgi:hypothetical protein